MIRDSHFSFDNFFQDGMECLANSRNDISFAKTEMEYLIARSRKAIEEYDGGSSAASTNSATTTPLGSPRASFKCVASVENVIRKECSREHLLPLAQ